MLSSKAYVVVIPASSDWVGITLVGFLRVSTTATFDTIGEVILT